ncbi:MAG: hypothetical protein HY040_24560 [Planctomycetes bacterium]|nr:hypothetical protein [Planctomycetota bacterium]
MANELLTSKLQQYMFDMLNTNVRDEFEYQLEVWRLHLADIADAQQQAVQRFQGVFEEVARQEEEERRKNFEYGMFILSLFSGPALSWAAGAIQYGLYAKVAQKLASKASWLNGAAVKTISDDKVWAKVSGDAGKAIFSFFIDKGINNVVQAPNGQAPNTADLVNSIDPAAFKSKLDRAMVREKWLTREAITSVAQNAKSPTFDVAKELFQADRWNETAPFYLQEQVGQKLIHKWVNEIREWLAREGHYFGNDPAKLDIGSVAQTMEREMWALWVLQQDFRVVFFDQDGEGHGHFLVKSQATGLFALEPQPIVRRLRWLGAPADDFLTSIGLADAAGAVFGKAPAKRRQYSDNPDMNKNAGADVQKSLDMLLNWATNRPLEVKDFLNKGPNKAIPRKLPSVEQVPAYINSRVQASN